MEHEIENSLEHIAQLARSKDKDGLATAAIAGGAIGLQATAALAGLGKAGRASLVTALKSETPHIRAGAAAALAEIGEKTAAKPLAALLGDSDAEVRAEAAVALGRLGDTSKGSVAAITKPIRTAQVQRVNRIVSRIDMVDNDISIELNSLT